jgi:hypothetical protein
VGKLTGCFLLFLDNNDFTPVIRPAGRAGMMGHFRTVALGT